MLFDVVLTPIEKLLQFILSAAYSITNNYGLSLIALSAVVNLLLLVIYLHAEKLQEKEIRVQGAMRNKLQEIKRCFQGQERFMMTQALYRIHRYHPIMGLRSMGSLIIQIPFFFAAYELIKHYDPLHGVSFLFIKDLAAPDAIFSFGRLSINILPILMTIINIFSAQIYILKKNPHALISTYVIALVFLVVLYSSPAALVLYWTCNNIFYLTKNIVLRYASPHAFSNRTTTYRTLKNKLQEFYSQPKKMVNTVICIWIFSLYLVSSYILIPHNRTRGEIPNMLINVSGVMLAFSALILWGNFFRRSRTSRNTTFIVVTCLYGLSFVTAIALIGYYISIPYYLMTLHSIKIKLFALLLLSAPNVFFLPHFMRFWYDAQHRAPPLTTKARNSKVYTRLLYVSSSALVCLMAITLPAEIFLSAPIEVGVPFTSIVWYNLKFMIAFLLLVFLVYVLTPASYKIYVNFVVLALLSILFLYAKILPFDIGRIDNFKLIFPQKIVPSFAMYVIEGMGIVALLFFLLSWVKTRPALLCVICAVSGGVLLFPVLRPALWKTDYFQQSDARTEISQPSQEPGQPASAVTTPPNSKDLLSFSTTKKNIVVILLDMANGGYVQRLLQEDKTVKNMYDGFVWYPNTLSVSTFTTTSKPAMLAGWNYAPENINNIEGDNLAEKIISAYTTMFDTFQDHNYHIAMTGVSYYKGDTAQCMELEEKGIACLDYWDSSYTGYWLYKNANDGQRTYPTSSLNPKKKIALVNLAGLLRATPFTFKQGIYDQGNWNFYVSEFKNQEGYNHDLKEWAFLDSMDSLSTTHDPHNKDDKARFKFIHTNVTHRPYALDEQCSLRNDIYPDPTIQNDYEGDASFFSLKCSLLSLGRWIQWLKDNNVFDNTKIILVSDHGNDFADDPMNTQHIAPQMMEREDTDMFTRAHVLLMVKDFNSTEEFSTNNRLMSNADLSSIVFHSIDGYTPPSHSHANDLQDLTKTNVTSRTLPIYHTKFYNWIDLVKEKDGFVVLDKYLVTDSIFEPENWKKEK